MHNENAVATFSKRPLVGAIRWDAWGGIPDIPNAPGSQTEKTLSPQKYHHRLPWYAKVLGENEVKIPLYTQELVDKEITYAHEASLDFWAYVMYEPGSTSLARELHFSSIHCNLVKWAAILGASMYSYSYYPWMVSQFEKQNYQKTHDGRPIVFVRAEEENDNTEIVMTLRQEANIQNVKEPYVVIMDAISPQVIADLKGDAISAYSAPGVDGETFMSMATNSIATWDKWLDWCKQVVPMVSTGWDPRPRLERPVTWYQGYGSNEWAQQPNSAAEVAQHLKDAIEWNNSQKNASDVLLIYAWNENDEGGWLMPTWTKQGCPDTSRVEAIRDVLGR